MAAATMYVTAAGAGAKDGAAWASAMGEAEFEADLEGGAEAGDIYYVQAGTYTLDSAYDASARDGTAIAPISIIGVKAATTAEPPTYADWPTVGSSDRPSFACAANLVAFGDYYKLYNTIWTGSGANIVSFGNACVVYNMKSTNSGTATKNALTGNTSIIFVCCEGTSPAGNAFSATGNGNFLIYCYLHDSTTLVSLAVTTPYCTLLNTVLDTATTGIAMLATYGLRVVNGIFYSCTTCVTATTSNADAFLNNIMDTATDAFKWTTQTDINTFWKNHQGNSVTRMYDTSTNKVASTLPHTDPAVSSGDPLFDGAAGGDFSLAAGSPCINNALTPTLGT